MKHGIQGQKKGISKKGPFLPNKGMREKMDFPAYEHALIDEKCQIMKEQGTWISYTPTKMVLFGKKGS